MRISLLCALCWLVASGATAQHEGHAMSDETSRNLFQTDMALMTGMTSEDPNAGMEMPGWHVMDLGIARLDFNGQGGPSGRRGVESSNWNMLHAARDLWGGRLSLMLMNSLEPATFPKRGSAQLFQTGEAFDGKPLVDRQHPHDFFMNLSATYRRQVGDRSAFWVQLAPVGEPALGPTAFMHRASAGDNPTAPLGHHWEDSTHIAFDVITVGYGWRAIAVEGSTFHGREPDQHRWDIEAGKLDSASVRVRVRAGDGWSGQVSYGFLESPEQLEPGNVRRYTASISYGADGDRPFAATVVFGRNDEAHGASDAWLLEGAWRMTALDEVYARLERVEKDYELLAFKGRPHGGGAVPRVATIGAYTAGYVRDFRILSGVGTGVGGSLTLNSFPSSLKSVYGDFPVSGHFFLRVRWGSAHAGPHAHGHSG
jgi:hypothetical protein